MTTILIQENSVLSNVVRQHVILLPMLNRFGIRLGLGDKSVKAVCEEKGIDIDSFLHIANSYIDPSYLKKVRLSPFYPQMVADYLARTNAFYIDAQIPNIEVHMSPLLRDSNDNPSLKLLARFLGEFKDLLLKRIAHDTEVLLPHFRALNERLGQDIKRITLGTPSEETTDKSEELISDIQEVMIKHLSGEFNDNLSYAVLFSLVMIEKDLSCNNRLRRRLFFPMLRAMEAELGVEHIK